MKDVVAIERGCYCFVATYLFILIFQESKIVLYKKNGWAKN